MPPRAVTWAVLLFWLATVGWMFYRDQVRETDLPPVFQFDLADEVSVAGAKQAQWEVFFQGTLLEERWFTNMSRKEGVFELSCAYRNVQTPLRLAGLVVREVSFKYRANRRGAVVGLEVKCLADPPGERFWVEVQPGGEAEDAWALHPRGEQEPALCRVPSTRGVFNPLHPSPEVAGLYPHQTWSVLALDPLENARPGALRGGHVKTVRWRAVVAADALPYRHRAVGGVTGALAAWAAYELPSRPRDLPCWRVDYADEGGALRARTWVLRDHTNQVLQQEVYYPEGTLRLVRERRGWKNRGQ
jgi:hypothetical protein